VSIGMSSKNTHSMAEQSGNSRIAEKECDK